jgi:hypothetical protein
MLKINFRRMLFTVANKSKLLLPVVALIIPFCMQAQVLLTTYADAGNNAISNSGYQSYHFAPAYHFSRIRVESAFGWTFAKHKEKKFDSYSCAVNYTFNVVKKPISATVLFLKNILSNNIRSTNIGILLNGSSHHFDFIIGNNYRRYILEHERMQSDEFVKNDVQITEPLNLVYSCTYNLNTPDKCWNVGITITDYDIHMIEQETNPLIHMKGSYSLNNEILPFILIGYKSAGLLNLSVNSFGYYFRMGLLWKLAR